GAFVSQGQVIGYVGCAGYCFGAHLHFEVRVNGSPVDPLAYL
ncbi:MAG: M23 family metallopeptidase, partial [Gaiellaceae bacterium]